MMFRVRVRIARIKGIWGERRPFRDFNSVPSDSTGGRVVGSLPKFGHFARMDGIKNFFLREGKSERLFSVEWQIGVNDIIPRRARPEVIFMYQLSQPKEILENNSGIIVSNNKKGLRVKSAL